MTLSPKDFDRLLWHIDRTVEFKDLARRDWRRQTDLVKEVFIASRLFVDLGEKAIFVDARISNGMILRALAALDKGQSLTGFFNARCHDAGLKSRRLFTFDTVTGNSMIVDRKGNSRARLHVHGIFECPAGWKEADLRKALKRVFGNAAPMGERQLHLRPAEVTKKTLEQHYTFNGVRANGPLGKVLYAVAHAGATYASLGLNGEGKRSRSTPWQGADTRAGERLARGIPSNFNRKIVFYDQKSGRAGKEAFEQWIAANLARADRLASGAGPDYAPPLSGKRTGTKG